jgi:hypothetical protein
VSSLFVTVSTSRTPALRPIQPSLQCIGTEVSLGISQSELEADRQRSSVAETSNA